MRKKWKEDIDRAIDLYFTETEELPEYLVMSPGPLGEFAWEIAKEQGLEDDDAYVFNLTNYRGVIVATCFDSNFDEFALA